MVAVDTWSGGSFCFDDVSFRNEIENLIEGRSSSCWNAYTVSAVTMMMSAGETWVATGYDDLIHMKEFGREVEFNSKEWIEQGLKNFLRKKTHQDAYALYSSLILLNRLLAVIPHQQEQHWKL
eukprot:gene30525-39780_t